MSIINKMHKELQENADNSPILASMPEKKTKQKVLLFCLISMLLVSSIGLSYLIYNKDNHSEVITEIADPEIVVITEAQSVTEGQTIVTATPTPVVAIIPVVIKLKAAVVLEKLDVTPFAVVKVSPSPIPVVVTATKTPQKVVAAPQVVNKENSNAQTEKSGYLEIKASILSNSQLANIHLKKAEIALGEGNTLLASLEKLRALNIKPDLHQVRKSLALYYYGIGEQKRTADLLKKGALTFPEYSDFNLMLSRIALKNGDQQKAYLYLNQHPPKVEGHLDYHVSYAILAQKFKNYGQAESLLTGLLTQRPNNGRWIMSLAIAQDKQGKQSIAIESYQRALLQIDLSRKAKKYMNQRLTYLANQ